DWVTVNAWVESRGTGKITVDAVRLLEIEDGALLGGSWEKYRLFSRNADELVWAAEALDQVNKNVSSRLVMGIWNSGNNSEAVLGFSIRHAWGVASFSRSDKGVRLSADVSLDIDVAPKGKVYAEAVHLTLGPVRERMEDLLEQTGRE